MMDLRACCACTFHYFAERKERKTKVISIHEFKKTVKKFNRGIFSLNDR